MPGALEEGYLSTGAIPAVAAETPGRPGLCGRGRERHLLSMYALVQSLQRVWRETRLLLCFCVASCLENSMDRGSWCRPMGHKQVDMTEHAAQEYPHPELHPDLLKPYLEKGFSKADCNP